ncbi:MAG: hypothetical protein AAFQ68_02995 [Bacteroidota bacterium]
MRGKTIRNPNSHTERRRSIFGIKAFREAAKQKKTARKVRPV